MSETQEPQSCAHLHPAYCSGHEFLAGLKDHSINWIPGTPVQVPPFPGAPEWWEVNATHRPGEGTDRAWGIGLSSKPPPGPPQLGRGPMQGLRGKDWGGHCPGSKCPGVVAQGASWGRGCRQQWVWSGCCRHPLGAYFMPLRSTWLAAMSMTLMMKAMAKAQIRLLRTHVWRICWLEQAAAAHQEHQGEKQRGTGQ